MKRSWIILIVIVIIGIWLYSTVKNSYNKIIVQDEAVNKTWADVQAEFQRRYNLIDNLVATVKGEADFEKSTLEAVIQARASATSMKVDANDLTDENLKEMQQRQGQLSQALGRLIMVSEQYPQLQTNQSFKNLQVSLEGTENRIKTAIRDYNDAVNQYNVTVRSFPMNFFASMFGFQPKPTYKADDAAQTAPKVDFSNDK